MEPTLDQPDVVECFYCGTTTELWRKVEDGWICLDCWRQEKSTREGERDE